MRKFILLSLFALIAVITAQAQVKAQLSLDGIVKNEGATKVYLQKFENKMYRVIDSTNIEGGRFSFSKADVLLPEIYGLTLDTTKGSLLVFLDKGTISVELDSISYYRNSTVSGSPLQDLYVDYKQQRKVQIDEFIKAHPSSLVAAYALYRDFSYRLSADDIRANIQLLDPVLHSTPYVKTLEGLIKTLGVVSVGKKAPDFTANTPDGNSAKLSDHLGKGYILVDFWASWCNPCRKENPNLLKAYNEFKDKGFDIFAISLDKSKDAWKTAIEKDRLTWTHVSDLRFWDSEPAKLYGVRAIPSNFLVDKNGVIVAKNLKGEDLIKTLNDLLN